MADSTIVDSVPSAQAVLAQLMVLVGTWHGTSEEGHSLTVSYRLVANQTVLVENWLFASGDEALTLYHCDGPHLMATHYCPLGNQPRLRWIPSSDPLCVFTCIDATNLPTPDSVHQHQFDIQVLSPTSFVRSETYVEHGQTASEAITYYRV